jgi:hypothetical protein
MKKRYNKQALQEALAWLLARANGKKKWLDGKDKSMGKKLNEIIERLERIEKVLDLYLSIEKAREELRKGEYVPNPFHSGQCNCGTSARCYEHFPHGSMPGDVLATGAQVF